MLVFFVLLAINDLYNLIFLNQKIFYRLAVWNALLLYAHYLGAFIFVGELILFAFFYKQVTSIKLKYFVFALLITLSLYSPKLIQFFNRIKNFQNKGTWVQKPHWSELYGNILKFFNFTPTFIITFSLLLIGFFIFRKSAIQNIKNKVLKPKYLFVFVVFGMYYFGMYIISLVIQPVFLDRYLLFTIPFLYLSLIIVLKLIIGEKVKNYYLAIFLIPMIISCYYIPNTNRDGDEIAKYAKSKSTQKTLITICPPFYDLTFIYHFDLEIFKDYKNYEQLKLENNIQSIYSFEDIKINTDIENILFVDAHSDFLFLGNNIKSELDKNYTFIDKKEFKGDYSVYEYKIND